jgi:methionyl-tRNA formyltransferase
MTPGLDAGPILAQQRTPIDPDEDASQLEERLARMGAGAVLEVIDALESSTAQPIVQDRAQASKAPRLKKEQGAIDWSRSSQAIKDQVRALRPWPRAYTFWHPAGADPMRLNVDRVTLAERFATSGGASAAMPSAGTVILSSPHLLIATGDAAIEIQELQPAGKRSMPAADFLRGNRVNLGDRFGPA